MPTFEQYRYYADNEVPAAMRRITEDSHFEAIASFIFPQLSLEEARSRLLNLHTIQEVQQVAMLAAADQILQRSVSHFSFSGLEKLSPDKHYLFVSNHRDITLDALLLQYVFLNHGFPSSRLVIGSNLLCMPVIEDIGKLNKTLSICRGGGCREFYNELRGLSEFIHFEITENNESVWIAQRNGRTKDGIDKTDPAIIKMFALGTPDNKINSICDLHIVPLSISYEWEPCDLLKAVERYRSRYTKYVKAPGEDLNSILTGILSPKGQVNLTINEPVLPDDILLTSGNPQQVAELLDHRINSGYKLFPTNYVAHDIRSGSSQYENYYTQDHKDAFLQRMEMLRQYDDCSQEALQEIFLGIYANPVINRQ